MNWPVFWKTFAVVFTGSFIAELVWRSDDDVWEEG